MNSEKALWARSEGKCELCGATDDLRGYPVPPHTTVNIDDSILLCGNCQQQIDDPESININHWRCLNDSMWSTVPAVQVMVWRMLNRLSSEGWPQELLDMLYLDDEILAWAQSGNESSAAESGIQHQDSNGAVLSAGDTVTLTKDLNVKGANFTAKRGTAVRGISLVPDNPKQIEGRVNGQQIVILTQFVKKSS